jgi:TolA-binding protein
MTTKKWTEDEEDFLKTNYMTMSNSELAEKFDITKNAVQKKLARMGLKRSQAARKTSAGEKSNADTVKERKPEAVGTESHFSLGNKFFYEERDYEKAIEEYRKAAAEESDELIRLKARYWMAECHVKTGKTEEAMNIFKTIADEHGYHYLGDSARRRGNALTEYIVPAT